MAQPVDTWDPEERQLAEVLGQQEQQEVRLSRIEGALSQIIQHLEQKGEPRQEPVGPWTMIKEEPN